MSTHDTCCAQVQADPFGENWGPALYEHAATCPSCRAFLDCVRTMRGRLQTLSSAREAMPAAMRGKLEAQLAECVACAEDAEAATAVRRKATIVPFTRRVLIPLAMAASLVVGIFAGRIVAPGSHVIGGETKSTIGQYIADVAHDHYLIERLGRPLEVSFTDADKLSQWLSGALSFSFDLPRNQGSLALQGGRVWHTVGRLSAMACYTTTDGRQVYLFAVPAANLAWEGAPSSIVSGTRVYRGEAWGHEARAWVDGDLAVALTAPDGDLPADWAKIFLP